MAVFTKQLYRNTVYTFRKSIIYFKLIPKEQARGNGGEKKLPETRRYEGQTLTQNRTSSSST